jgi:hypothetical protein
MLNYKDLRVSSKRSAQNFKKNFKFIERRRSDYVYVNIPIKFSSFKVCLRFV